MIPILSNATGRPVTVKKNGKTVKKMQPFSERVWANNQRLTYREYVFAKLWPMIEGNIAKGNREKAKRYLRSKLWKVALQWDPSEVTEESGLPGATGAATGKNTVS
jgi:Zn-dependent M32 family carboxypeptidase